MGTGVFVFYLPEIGRSDAFYAWSAGILSLFLIQLLLVSQPLFECVLEAFYGFSNLVLIIDPLIFIVPAHAAGARTFSCARESTQRVRPRGIHPLGEPLKVAAAGLLSKALRNDGSE